MSNDESWQSLAATTNLANTKERGDFIKMLKAAPEQEKIDYLLSTTCDEVYLQIIIHGNVSFTFADAGFIVQHILEFGKNNSTTIGAQFWALEKLAIPICQDEKLQQQVLEKMNTFFSDTKPDETWTRTLSCFEQVICTLVSMQQCAAVCKFLDAMQVWNMQSDYKFMVTIMDILATTTSHDYSEQFDKLLTLILPSCRESPDALQYLVNNLNEHTALHKHLHMIVPLCFDMYWKEKNSHWNFGSMKESIRNLMDTEDATKFIQTALQDALQQCIGNELILQKLCLLFTQSHGKSVATPYLEQLLQMYQHGKLELKQETCTVAMTSIFEYRYATNLDVSKEFIVYLANQTIVILREPMYTKTMNALLHFWTSCTSDYLMDHPQLAFVARTAAEWQLIEEGHHFAESFLLKVAKLAPLAKAMAGSILSILLPHQQEDALPEWATHRKMLVRTVYVISQLIKYANDMQFYERLHSIMDKSIFFTLCKKYSVVAACNKLLEYAPIYIKNYVVIKVLPQVLAIEGPAIPGVWSCRKKFRELCLLYAFDIAQPLMFQDDPWYFTPESSSYAVFVYGSKEVLLQNMLIDDTLAEYEISCFYAAYTCRFPLQFGYKLVQHCLAHSNSYNDYYNDIILAHGAIALVKVDPLIVTREATFPWLQCIARRRFFQHLPLVQYDLYVALHNVRKCLGQAQWNALLATATAKQRKAIMLNMSMFSMFDTCDKVSQFADILFR